MTLVSGTRLGSYDIVAPLGAGRARDRDLPDAGKYHYSTTS